jgi:dipeptidase
MNRQFSIIVFLIVTLSYPLLAVKAALERDQSCTVLIAGKKTTVDGSILFVKSEDDGPMDIDHLWYVPRKQHSAGSTVTLKAGGIIPQVVETYAYFWDQCPGTAYSNGFVNEWGVAFGSNGCVSREDSLKEVEARGDLVKGGIGFRLRMILAERCKTARQAVELAARLIDRYGYNASGRNLNIVGPQQAWQIQMVRGKNYVARRVQDDEVAIVANTFTIRRVDVTDSENFICSPGLISYAIKRGWYDPQKDGEFDFARAYAPESAHTSPSNNYRQWMLARLLNKKFPISAEESRRGGLPAAVKPDRKLSLRAVITIFRNHYEGTELDSSGFTASGQYQDTPHKTRYTICNTNNHRTTVIQQREWLPPAIGTVVWRALDEPCSSVFVPWYLGANRIPGEFCQAPESLYTTSRDLLDFHFTPPAETWQPDMESAPGVFMHLGRLVDVHYPRVIDYVKGEWQRFEDQAFALQPHIEKTALELYNKDEALAREYLNLYTGAQAIKSLKMAKNLIKEIKQHIWRGHSKIRRTIEVAPKVLEPLAGQYKLDSGAAIAIVKQENRLFVVNPQGQRYELFPEREDFFFLKVADIQIHFIFDTSGPEPRVNHLIIHQSDQQTRATRLE